MGEGAAVAVLTGQAHRMAVDQKCAEGERLGGRPVDAPAGRQGLLLGFQLADDLAVGLEALRHVGQRRADFLQGLRRHPGLAAPRAMLARGAEAAPGALQPIGLVDLVALRGLEIRFQALAPLPGQGVGLARGQDPLGGQAIGVDLPRGRMAVDRPVHQRLGEGRLVALVVAEAPVAEHVDHHVLLEGLAELDGDARDMDDRLRIVAVDVQDRRLDHLGDVGAIGPRAGVHRVRGEADLVVQDEVDRAADPIALELRQVQGLGHQPLAGEGGVAVHQQGHGPRAVDVLPLHLLGAHLADDHRVDRFQVRGVGGQGQVDRVAVELPVRGGAEVVLDVARAADILRVCGAALELGEDRGEGLGHEVGEHVEAAAVRHADDHLLEAQPTAALEDLLERRDHRLAAVEPEALGAGVALVEELLESLGGGQALEDRPLAFRGEVGLVVDGLDALLYPGLLVRLLDVHELDADGAAIGLAHDLEDLPQARGLDPQHVVDEDRPVQVLGAEAVALGIELRMRLDRLQAQRIEVGLQVAAHPVGADQHERANRIERRRADVVGRDSARADHPGGDRGGAVAAVEAGKQGPSLVVKVREKAPPRGFQRAGLAHEGLIEPRHLGGIGAVLK